MLHRLLSIMIGLAFVSTVWAFDSWPQWRGPNRDGVSVEKGLLDSLDKEPPLVWKAKGMGVGYSGVAVDRGIVCTMGNRNDRTTVIALNAKDGKEIWATDIDDAWNGKRGYPGSRCTPTIDGERIYAVSPQGTLVCLKTTTGKLVWKKNYTNDLDGLDPSGDFGFSESLLVDGDKVICSPRGERVVLVALNKHTGAELWRSIGMPLKTSCCPYSSTMISRGAGIKQYVQVTLYGVTGVHPETGKVLWTYYRKEFIYTSHICSTIIRGDYVFIPIGWGSGSALLKLERDGNGVKAREVYFIPGRKLRIENGECVLVGDYLYTTHIDGSPRCVEFLTGKMMWKKQRTPGTGRAAITYADGHLYYRYENGVMALIAAKPNEFQLKGTFQIPDAENESWSYPSISNGRLYMREQNVLYCYDVKKK